MGDALIEFGNPTLASQARDLLNGLKFGSQTLAVHPLASGYQDIFVNYFDKNVQIEIKVQRDTPVVGAHISSSSEDITKEIDHRQVPVEHVIPDRGDDEFQASACEISDHSPGQMNCDASHRDECSESTSSTMTSTVLTNRPADETKKSRVNEVESLQEVVRSIVGKGLVADYVEEKTESSEFQERDTLDSSTSDCSHLFEERNDSQDKDTLASATSDSSGSMLPGLQPLDKEPQALVLDEGATTRQAENLLTAFPQDQFESSQEMENDESSSPDKRITEIDEEEPRGQEPIASQQDENNPVKSEMSKEGSILVCRTCQPLTRTCHPITANDLEINRMREEIAELKSEQVEKDQLVEDLKKENEDLKQETVKIANRLDDCKRNAQLYLEKLVGQQMLQRKLVKVEEEVDRLRRENDDLRPKLQCKEEETKQLKVDVYDLMKVRCDVIAGIKKLCCKMDRIKSDEDSSGGDQISTDHETFQGIDSVSLGTILEMKKHLEEATSNIDSWNTRLEEAEAENEQLRDEKSELEEELEQMRMCRAMEQGFAGE